MEHKSLSSGSFEYMMKNALIERYRDEVKSLRKESESENDFAEVLRREMEKKAPPAEDNKKG